MTTPNTPNPPELGAAGFGRDVELEKDRGTKRPAAADLDSSETKADQEPILGPAPDPDVYPSATTHP
jgi:hypothetical protein